MTSNPIVLIDSSKAAYTIFTALATQSHQPQPYVDTPGMRFVAVAELLTRPDRYFRIGRANEHLPDQNVIDTIVTTLQTSPGMPIGLTWNGGIAITFGDYQYAQKMYEQQD